MRVVWDEVAWEQYVSWQDRTIVKRINDLIRDISRGSDGGLGKPEILRGELAGLMSRRINQEHRLVYRVRGGDLEIMSCRFHYRK